MRLIGKFVNSKWVKHIFLMCYVTEENKQIKPSASETSLSWGFPSVCLSVFRQKPFHRFILIDLKPAHPHIRLGLARFPAMWASVLGKLNAFLLSGHFGGCSWLEGCLSHTEGRKGRWQPQRWKSLRSQSTLDPTCHEKWKVCAGIRADSKDGQKENETSYPHQLPSFEEL